MRRFHSLNCSAGYHEVCPGRGFVNCEDDELRADRCECECHCLIDAAAREEAKKPPHLRTNAFLISCPCSKCSKKVIL